MTAEDAAPEVAEATLVAAWRTVRLLSADDERLADELAGPARRISAELGAGEIARGLILLLAGLLSTVEPDRLDDDGEDMVADLLKAMVVKLRAVFGDELDPDVLPMLAGVLTAALTGRDALRWRERFGVPDQSEAIGLTYLVWLVRDFLDSIHDSPGTTDRLINDLFGLDSAE